MLQLTGAVQPAMVTESLALIADRIRGEFREMPGLGLTAVQACRLWSLDMATCTAVISQLISAGFLCLKADGVYTRTTDLTVRPRMAKAEIRYIDIDHPRTSDTTPGTGTKG